MKYVDTLLSGTYARLFSSRLAVAPLSTFSTSIKLHSGSKVTATRVLWYTLLPPVAPAGVAAVLSAPGSEVGAVSGLYVSYHGEWQLVVPYPAVCDYAATGLQLSIYLDVSSRYAVAADSFAFKSGEATSDSFIPAGPGIWAVVTLDALVRTRAVAAATASTLGGIRSGGDVSVCGNGTVTLKCATQADAGIVRLANQTET